MGIQACYRWSNCFDPSLCNHGDFNAQLPKQAKLNRNWHKESGKGFTSHSALLYNFLVANDLVVLDFLQRQEVSYSYFCHKSNAYTWIYHIIGSAYDIDAVQSCNIIPEESDNLSDHLPLRVSLKLRLSQKPSDSNISEPQHTLPKWKNQAMTVLYQQCLKKELDSVPDLDLSALSNSQSAQATIDTHVDAINSAFHKAATKAGCIPERKFKPKPFWCPELSKIRDQKRFWFQLWISCGRPKSGAVYDCHKLVKKTFRRTLRQNVNGHQNQFHFKLNDLHQSRTLSYFWNTIKRSRRKQSNSTLLANQFATQYKATMSDDNNLSPVQLLIKEKATRILRSVNKVQ